MNKKPTSIILDLGGVILNIDFAKVTNEFKILGVNNFEEKYSQSKANHLFRHFETGKIKEAEFYNVCRREMNFKITNEQIKNAWNSMLLNFREMALHTLVKIKPKYKLFLLSNTNIIHLKCFEDIYQKQVGGSIAKYFDKIYYSHQIGLRKPDKEAFEYVLKENDLVVAQTVFIDDSLQNIDAAKNLGLQTIHLKEGMKLEVLDL